MDFGRPTVFLLIITIMIMINIIITIIIIIIFIIINVVLNHREDKLNYSLCLIPLTGTFITLQRPFKKPAEVHSTEHLQESAITCRHVRE